MSDDNQRQEDATSPDLSLYVATGDDIEYTLSIDEALSRYEAAGLPRTPRSIQRYCKKGHLKSHRIETPFGEKFLINPESVDAHIAYINELRLAAISRDPSRHVATTTGDENIEEQLREGQATVSDDNQRQGTMGRDKSQPVAADPTTVQLLKGENEFLRGQMAVKDGQIAALLERDRETNILIQSLQTMLTPLLGAPERAREDRG